MSGYAVLWTTADEVNFIRQLFFEGKAFTLRQYICTLPYRTFDGRGMCVEPHKVYAEAVKLVKKLGEEKERDETDLLGRRAYRGLDNETLGRSGLLLVSRGRMAG